MLGRMNQATVKESDIATSCLLTASAPGDGWQRELQVRRSLLAEMRQDTRNELVRPADTIDTIAPTTH